MPCYYCYCCECDWLTKWCGVDHRSPAEIRSMVVQEFHVASKSGTLDVHIINTGKLRAQYTVQP